MTTAAIKATSVKKIANDHHPRQVGEGGKGKNNSGGTRR
jgi:hypothetical protein